MDETWDAARRREAVARASYRVRGTAAGSRRGRDPHRRVRRGDRERGRRRGRWTPAANYLAVGSRWSSFGSPWTIHPPSMRSGWRRWCARRSLPTSCSGSRSSRPARSEAASRSTTRTPRPTLTRRPTSTRRPTERSARGISDDGRCLLIHRRAQPGATWPSTSTTGVGLLRTFPTAVSGPSLVYAG